jgi:hypothetical protein
VTLLNARARVRVAEGDANVLRGPVQLWYRDLISCLQATFATVLDRAGHDPLEVLGSHWEFLFKPGDVRSEEFYFPCRYEGDLGHSLAPHHPVNSRWEQPAKPDEPLAEIAELVAANQPVIAAVDNFYLPFRPAFGDVHAAHLIVVWGLDVRRGLVYIADAMPPSYHGHMPTENFLRAWTSVNPSDEQDVFFSDTQIDRRFLTVALGQRFPKMDDRFLRKVLDANLSLYQLTEDPNGWVGEAGLHRFLDDLVDRARAGEAEALADTYPFGWGMQAQSSLHGELLRRWGAKHDVPEVSEAGRLVEAVAHSWTGLRITAAHGTEDPPGAAEDLARHAQTLRRRFDEAIGGIYLAREAL